MQKKIIALAIAAAFAAPVAMAETANVNVYGSVDAGLRNQSTPGIGNISSFAGTGTYNSNRWGIKGSEDMGDGLKATFGLEGAMNLANGASGSQLFDRQATVGLASEFGALDLGRQYSVPFKTIGAYDPFGFKYIKIAYAEAAAINTRFDNDISYTGTFGGVKIMAEHAMDNSALATTPAVSVTGAQTAGATLPTSGPKAATTAVGVSFDGGLFSVGGAYSITKSAAAATPETETKYYTVGGAIKIGDAAKVSIGMSQNTLAGKTSLAAALNTTDTTTKFAWIGASLNVGSKVGVTAAVYKRAYTAGQLISSPTAAPEATNTTMMVGATYALSKRTTLYAEIDKNEGDSGSQSAAVAANGGSTYVVSGTSFGLAHVF